MSNLLYGIRGLLSNLTVTTFLWIIIGITTNTASPHIPPTSAPFGAGVFLHSWLQYIISVIFWPLAHWHPTFTVGKWTPLYNELGSNLRRAARGPRPDYLSATVRVRSALP